MQQTSGRGLGSPVRTRSAGSADTSGLEVVSLGVLMATMGVAVDLGGYGGLLASQMRISLVGEAPSVVVAFEVSICEV